MYVQLTVSHHRSNYSKEKALGMTYWINTQLSILSMQIEIEVLHLPLDFRKAQWKTWYMHPFPPCYPPPLKGWQLHHSESKFWSQYLAAQRYFFFFFFFSRSSGNQGSYRHHRIHFISLAACALSVVILWRLSMTPQHFVVIFNMKYPFRDYLMLLSVYSPLRLHGSR